MALTVQELEATTQEFWEPGHQNIYIKGNVLFNELLRSAKPWDGGTHIRQVVYYGEPLGGDFNATSLFNTAKVEALTAARWTPAYYYEPVTYDIDDVVQNAGVAQEIDVVNAKLTQAAVNIRLSMATDLYTTTGYGTSGRKLAGLLWMCSQTSSYGGISPDDLPQWKAGYVSTTAKPISFDVIDSMLTSCQVGDEDSDEPNLLITTRTLFSAIRSLTLPHLRLEHGRLADMGFQNIDYNGRPIVRDFKCPDGYFFALNTKYMGFRVHKDFNFKRTPWMRPTNQYLFTCQLLVVLQMICKRRDAHGYHANLTA